MASKVIFIVYITALLVVSLGGSVLKVDLAGAVKKSLTSGFGLNVMLGGSIYVTGPCIVQLACGTIYNLA